MEWLEYLRDYRHHLVHRIFIMKDRCIEIIPVLDQKQVFLEPILITKHQPIYSPDTRESRMLSEKEVASIKITQKIEDKEDISYYEMLIPANMIRIEVFMENHLDSFEKYFKDSIEGITRIEFREI